MKQSYKIEVDCANCAAKMERALAKLEGVQQVRVNYLTQKLTLETEGDQKALLKQVVQTCKRVDPDFALEA